MFDFLYLLSLPFFCFCCCCFPFNCILFIYFKRWIQWLVGASFSRMNLSASLVVNFFSLRRIIYVFFFYFCMFYFYFSSFSCFYFHFYDVLCIFCFLLLWLLFIGRRWRRASGQSQTGAEGGASAATCEIQVADRKLIGGLIEWSRLKPRLLSEPPGIRGQLSGQSEAAVRWNHGGRFNANCSRSVSRVKTRLFI